MTGRIADVRHLHTERRGVAWRHVDVVKFSLLALWYGVALAVVAIVAIARARYRKT